MENITPPKGRTPDAMTQLFRTCVIGVISFVVDAAVLVALTEAGLHYLVSNAAGFFISLCVNYALNRRYVFPECSLPIAAELGGYLAVAVIGLGMSEALLFAFVDKLGAHYIVSKFAVAAIVLAWTFSARKFILYRRR